MLEEETYVSRSLSLSYLEEAASSFERLAFEQAQDGDIPCAIVAEPLNNFQRPGQSFLFSGVWNWQPVKIFQTRD